MIGHAGKGEEAEGTERKREDYRIPRPAIQMDQDLGERLLWPIVEGVSQDLDVK